MGKLAYEIIKDGNPILRKKSVDVQMPLSAEDEKIINFLHDYLVISCDDEKAKEYDARPGVGLAAPQVGFNRRMLAIYIPYPDETGKTKSITQFSFVNPKLISSAIRPAYLVGGEGCLSIDDAHPGHVIRSSLIVVKGYDYLTKQYVQVKFRGYEAIVVQHELDHLEGILYYDRIDKKDPEKKIPGALEI